MKRVSDLVLLILLWTFSFGVHAESATDDLPKKVVTPPSMVSGDASPGASSNYKIKELDSLVEQEVNRQVDSRFKQISWLAAIIGFIGFGTLGTLANYAIEKVVERRIEKRTGNISSALDFSKFYTLTLKLELGDGFSRPDVDAILSYLRKIENNSEIRFSTEFKSGLTQVAESFVRASQSSAIDEIFSMYEREILGEPTLVQPLLHHYGQEIVSRTNTPDKDVALQTFEKLERIASSSRVPELGMAYRALYEAKSASNNVKVIVKNSIYLEEQDRTNFLRTILRRTKAENWMRRVTPEGKAIETVAQSFFSLYKDCLEEVYGFTEEALNILSTSGLSDEESIALAIQISSAIEAQNTEQGIAHG